ncbi:MAG: type II secretion system secretin GspD, partial [Planctomycetota bacterium]|nr:type II secretion system secretin GspD [Planctomycetota bacterium]
SLAGELAAQENKQEDQLVDINFQDVDVEQLLIWASRYTNTRFLYDASIKGKKISLYAKGNPVPQKAVFSVLQSALEMQKYMLVPVGDPEARIFKVRVAADASKLPVPVLGVDEDLPTDERMITSIITLKYADPRAVQVALQGLLTQGPGGIQTIEEVNAIILTDYALNLQRLTKIIELMDREKPGIKVEVIELKNASPTDLQQRLSQFAQTLMAATATRRAIPGQPAGQPEPLQFIADVRTSSLIILGMEERINQMKDLIAKLDKDVEAPPRKIHIYSLKHGNAKTMADYLNQIYSDRTTRPTTPSTPGEQPGAARPSPIYTAPGSSGTDQEPPPRIVPDEKNNALIIVAPQEVFDELKLIIVMLDVRRPQVFIEAAIVEVSGEGKLEFGFELSQTDGVKEGQDRGFGSTHLGMSTLEDSDDDGELERVPAMDEGLWTGIFKDKYGKIPILLQMYKTRTDVTILSNPQIVTNDNEKATFKVGDSEATATRTYPGGGQQSQLTFAGYQEAAIFLEVTPQISENNYLRLLATVKIEKFGARPFAELPRNKKTRELTASITVPNERTLVIGGLTATDETEEERGIPFFKDIPVLGELFKRTETETKKT